MVKFYNDIYNSIHQFVNDDSFKKCDLLIFDLNKFNYTNKYNEDLEKIKEILSMASYIIKGGGNILIIGSDIIKDIDIDEILKNELLWHKQRTIVYKSELKFNELLASEYNYIFWYSDNFRPNDSKPICNNFDDGKELSDFWDDNINIYKKLIKMFSNENDTIFEPLTDNKNISKYCEELNRNYIGFKNDE